MDKKNILHEIETLLRTMPAKTTFLDESAENYSWFGQLKAIVAKLDVRKSRDLKRILSALFMEGGILFTSAFLELNIFLHTIRSELRLEVSGPTSTLTDTGLTFDYFDEIRKIIQLASSDILFVDPYLDADFIAKYLPFVKDGVSIRLLSSQKKLPTLIPSASTFADQSKKSIEIKSNNFHDRFIFIDGKNCYQSGASFKDGSKNAPTTITEITDAFPAMLTTYEKLWDEGKKEL